MKKYVSILLIALFGINIFIDSVPKAAMISNENSNTVFVNKYDYCYRVDSSNAKDENINIDAIISKNSIVIRWMPDLSMDCSYDIEIDGQVNSIGSRCTYEQKDLQPNSKHLFRIRSNYKAKTGI